LRRTSLLCHSFLRIRLTTFLLYRYDAWSLGATLLEIYIGTPHALTDPTFENALISLCLFDSYDEISRLKFILNNDNDQENKNSITVRKRCDANVFRQRLQLFDDDDDEEVDQQEQDKDHLLIDLIYRLLDPNPKSRMRIDRAIHDHAYVVIDTYTHTQFNTQFKTQILSQRHVSLEKLHIHDKT
jgi:serine/threonine protein kinase